MLDANKIEQMHLFLKVSELLLSLIVVTHCVTGG